MNYNFLYEHAHVKHINQLFREQAHLKHILTQSNKPKTSLKSNQILTKKLFSQLQQYDDHQIISLATSLPILYSAKMIQMLKTIQQAKDMLNDTLQNGKYLRMSYEAKFVFYLWQVIGKQETQTLNVKKMIYLFHQKKGEQLRQILIQMANNKTDAQQLYEAWRMIKQNKLYYQSHKNCISQQTLKTQPNCKQNKEYAPQVGTQKKSTLKKNHIANMFSTKSLRSQNKFNDSLNQTNYRSIHNKLYQQNFYEKRQQLMQQQKQNKQKKEMEQCTFYPLLQTRNKTKSKQKSVEVKGFNKTINRLMNGYNKSVQYRKSLQKYSRGEKYDQIRSKPLNPPKFLQRKKKQKKFLFSINFEINNKKTTLKIKQKQSALEAAKKIAIIYGLNKNYQQQLEELIQQQMDNFNKKQQK